MSPRAQLARGQFLVADIEPQQGLNRIDLALVAPIQLVLDHVKKLSMQPLNKIESLELIFAYRRRATQRHRGLRFGHRRHHHSPRFAGPTLLLRPD